MEEYSDGLEKELEALETEVEALNAMINELLKRVSKEEDRGLQTLPEVEKWISMAEKTESNARSLFDKSISECYNLSTFDDCSQISESTIHYREAVRMTMKEVKALRSEGVFKELVKRAPLSHVKKMLPLQPIPIVSREMLLEKAWKCLAENVCGTLGLYGVAGVGKTTLLTQLKNKFIEAGYVSSRFVPLVVLEPEQEVEGIQVAIMKRLHIQRGQSSQLEKASEIYKFLNGKRFVLLLDGVQRERVNLEEIGVPLPSRENGCKILFTSRSQGACGTKWVDTEFEVKCFSPEEAWDFFQDVVGETTLKSHPDIPRLARIIARKCGGLPIALSLIGQTMSGKRTIREWHHAIHVLVSSTAEFSGMEAEVLPILKLTYDNLPGENIRSCFLYCALLPKNCDIRKEDLVDYWIGEGIIAKKEDREIAEIQGYEMIDDLVSVRLLMEDESGYLVKMHGMVREMALWIASDFGKNKENFVVVGGVGIHQMPMVNDWRIIRRMSVTSTQIEKISESPNCPMLTTLFLQDNNLQFSGDFFQWMTSLVVLNLSHNRELSELPEEISSLVSLRLLNLSWTWIKRLPLGLKELKRLIHLDLDDTPFLRDIDVIGCLLNLQVLRLFRSVPMDLSLMEDVQLLKSLKDLCLTVKDVDVLKRLLSIHQLASCIRHLHLRGITITDGGILLLNSMLCLRELNIWMCDIPQITIQKEALHSGNIEKFPLLQNIRTVTLSGCTGIRDLTWLLFAPNLGDLTLHECQQIERIINKDKATADTSEQPFQNLTRLSLSSLPKLESIYWDPLPCPVLEYLYIRACPKLTRRPFNSDIAKGNQVLVDLDQEWIEGVEWEDEATKQHFSNFASDRDFPKMDGLASASHPTNDMVMVETTESGKSTTANSITGEKVFQSKTHATMKPDGMISNMDTPGFPMDFSSLHCFELGKLVLSSGLLHALWNKISASPTIYLNQDSGLEIQIYQEKKYTTAVFVAPPICSHLNSASTLLSESQDHNPFRFLCSEKISSFSIHTPALQLFVSAYQTLLDLKSTLLKAKKPVIITGAELGGSVASLFTLWLLDTVQPKLTRPLCITFGSPLIGDANLQQILENSSRISCFLHVADASQTPINAGFKPFGMFLICIDSVCICIDDPEAIMELLLSGANTDVVGWRDYGQVLHRLAQPVVVADSRLMIDDIISKMKGRDSKKPPRFDPVKKFNEMKISMMYVEWYKKKWRNANGYYDQFKTQPVFPYEDRRRELNDYWISLVEEIEKKPRSEKSVLKTRTLLSGHNYRRMLEPLDIAEYYRSGRTEYRTSGRSRHYVMLEKWFKAGVRDLIPMFEARDVWKLVTFDSCFWAEVEEAMIVTTSLMRDGEKEVLLGKLRRFKEYVWEMISNSEVSPEIFLKGSSFMKWWEGYKKINGFSSSPSEFTEFMDRKMYESYLESYVKELEAIMKGIFGKNDTFFNSI